MSPDGMEFWVLGPVEVAVDGRPVGLASDRQRALLAALLVRAGERVHADALAEAVWDGRPPASARTSLRSHVARLRKVLAGVGAGEVFVTVVDGYRVDLTGHVLDAERFETLLCRAREARDRDPKIALERLDDALALWRGAAYDPFADREFARAEAIRLTELRAAAAADRVDALLALGRHAEVVGEIEAAVTAEPLAERPHGQMMVALYRCGRQADALAVYRGLQDRLADELGVDPGPALQRLYEEVLRQEPHLDPPAPTSRTPAAASPAVPAATPLDAGPASGALLIGRDADVKAVSELLASCRHLTLTGPGGVGKTTLAEAVAASLAERFEDGAHTCALAAVREPASLTEAVLGSLGIPHSDDRPPAEVLLAALAARRMLLVLDNCEQLLPTVADLVAAISRRCHGVTVLATSRQRLHLRDERIWQVAPLDVPLAAARAADVRSAPAGALFCARAQAVSASFELTDDDAPAIAEICRRLDGIPLALELAAARMSALTPTDLAARLDQRFRLLTSGAHDQERRHRTLESVIDWSYDLLEPREARLFERLSVFAGQLTLRDAEQVCAGDGIEQADVAAMLADLVDKSMVVAIPAPSGETRFQLLATLRDYAAQRLWAGGSVEQWRQTHAHHLLERTERLAPGLRGSDEAAAVTALDTAVDDLRLAFRWVADTGDVTAALRLCDALHEFVTHRMRTDTAAWAEQAVNLPGAPDHEAWAGVRATAAWSALCRRDLDGARQGGEEALARAEPDGEPARRTLRLLADIALLDGRLADCVELADRLAGLAMAAGDAYDHAAAGISRVLALLNGGDIDLALEGLDTTRQAADASGSPTMRAWALLAHGEALADRDHAEAGSLLEQAIEIADGVGSRLVAGIARVALASLLGRHGPITEAAAAFHAAIAHWRRLGNPLSQVTALRNLVPLLARAGLDEPAARLHGTLASLATPVAPFGAEAARLADAWSRVEGQLGPRAHHLAEQGASTTLGEAVDEALSAVSALLPSPEAH